VVKAPFEFRIPSVLLFGAGKAAELPRLAGRHGTRCLLIAGGDALERSGGLERILGALKKEGTTVFRATAAGEPTPELVDSIAGRHRADGIECVISVGGGSVIDAGRAVAAMLVHEGPVEGYLEGVGTRPFDGRRLPFIAVPTTAGTGSEAARNAVISRVGPSGFKRSLRHDGLMPDAAVVDPELHRSCPPAVTAACGMDAVTQLLESAISLKANPLTDALAESGLAAAGKALPAAWRDGEDLEARSRMAYAAYLSGVTLTNAGLGVVHGFASSVGGRFPIPHGALCGTLLEPCLRRTIDRLKGAGEVRALARIARAGRHLTGSEGRDLGADLDALLGLVGEWARTFRLPRLGEFGMTAADVPALAAATGCKDNPVVLPPSDLEAILRERL
jgi:alcohol dehydrogenase class IV